MLNACRLPAGNAGKQKALALALTLSAPAFPLAVPDAARSRLVVNDWEVLDARQFGAPQPLSSAFGHTWRVGGVAVLLRRRVTSADEVPTVSVASVQDAAGADVKGRHDKQGSSGAKRAATARSFCFPARFFFPWATLRPPR